jgi:di/tricarboxylate transporter
LTNEIAIVLGILAVAIILFITERIRVDLVALIVLVSLAVTNLVTPTEAISGFSNIAVVTVWAILILSAGLSRTGVANVIGKQLLRFAGDSELRLVAIIMVTAGILSGFMNSIGVAALFLPVVIDIARQTGRPPSRLLMPLAFASLLGGLNTLIGTPPNILISEALREADLDPFEMFDFAPVGVVVLLVGIAFMTFLGRHLLPRLDIRRDASSQNNNDLAQVYDISERLYQINLPDGAILSGKTLAKSRLGSALGLNVIAILRGGESILAPRPDTVLESGDELLVEGNLDLFDELRSRLHILLEEDHVTLDRLTSEDIIIGEAKVSPSSTLVGVSLLEANFRQRFDVIVLAIWRNEAPILTNLASIQIQPEDVFLVQGCQEEFELLGKDPEFEYLKPLSNEEVTKAYHLHKWLLSLRVPEGSILAGRSLTESRLGDAFGIGVLGIIRMGRKILVPSPEDPINANDLLLVKGDPAELHTLRGLQELVVDYEKVPDLADFESDHISSAEVVLSPHSTLAGNTLRRLHFREKFGLSVLAIWRSGRAYRSNLRDIALRFGDALLLYGPREKLRLLGREPDFLVLTEEGQEPPRLRKAPVALLIMGFVLLTVIMDWMPIAIAAVLGMVLMVLSGSLTMEEAYRAIEWKAIFLIAGMLPLGIAMERTGAASYLAEVVVSLVGDFGPVAVVAGLFVLASLASQVMPNPAVAVLLAPVALSTASDLGISPYPLMMTVAISASAAFLSPVGHPANVLIMGPGGYKFSDYVKVGLPLTIAVLVVVLLVLPLVWPF